MVIPPKKDKKQISQTTLTAIGLVMATIIVVGGVVLKQHQRNEKRRALEEVKIDAFVKSCEESAEEAKIDAFVKSCTESAMIVEAQEYKKPMKQTPESLRAEVIRLDEQFAEAVTASDTNKTDGTVLPAGTANDARQFGEDTKNLAVALVNNAAAEVEAEKPELSEQEKAIQTMLNIMNKGRKTKPQTPKQP